MTATFEKSKASRLSYRELAGHHRSSSVGPVGPSPRWCCASVTRLPGFPLVWRMSSSISAFALRRSSTERYVTSRPSGNRTFNVGLPSAWLTASRFACNCGIVNATSASPEPVTPWYPSVRAIRSLSLDRPFGLLGLGHDHRRRNRLHLFSPRPPHLREAIAVDGQLQTARVERVQRRVSVHATVQRFVPRRRGLPPLLLWIAVVVSRVLL